MKRPNRIAAAFGAIILVSVTLVGAFSASATGGDQSNPLITLSYLTQVLKPELLGKVDKQVAANEQALLGKVESAIDGYSKEMEKALGVTGGNGAVYTLVTLAKDQLLCPGVGAEVLLRSGTAKAMSGSVPVMMDATSGSAVSIGGVLQANHLYVVPLEGSVIAATSDCTLLISGEYVIV